MSTRNPDPSAKLHFTTIAAIFSSLYLENVHFNHHRIYVRCIGFLILDLEQRIYWSGAEPGTSDHSPYISEPVNKLNKHI
jgi:hypothetical protein